jgi:hypothetical protein
MPTEAQQFSTRLLDELKANGHTTSATYLARQIHVNRPVAIFLMLVIDADQIEMIGNLNIPAVIDFRVKIVIQKTVVHDKNIL